MLKTIPFYQRIIIICCSLIDTLFKLIKDTYQPAMVSMQSEIKILRGTIRGHREEIETRDAKHLEESAILLGQIKLGESNHALVVEENRALKEPIDLRDFH